MVKVFCIGWICSHDTLIIFTWKTLGALTKDARAEERVAEKIPALIMGPNPETMLIALLENNNNNNNTTFI